MAFTQDFRTQRRNYADGQTRIGEKDRLWYDSESNSIRIGDGETPGGIAVGGSGGTSYTLPTATTTVKGGVKIDGTTINIADQVISVGTVPYSNLSGAPTAVSAFTNDSGYLTSSSLSSYATQSYVTGRGYITSADLPTAVSELTNDSGYLTDAEFDLDTIDYNSNNKLHATGILPGDTNGFTAIFAGRAAGIAALPNTVLQSQAQVNDYAQNNFQNTNDGNHASTEWVATSPNGDDSNYYIDFGINGASWDGTASNSLYDNVGQRDGWLYVQGGNAGGGNLILGTSIANTYTKIIAGDASTGDREVARFSSTEVKLSKQLTFSDNTTQTTAWTGSVSYNDLTDTPTLVTSYNDLTDLPTLITSYNELANKPTLFSGAYADLTGKPTLFSGSYNDLTDTPVTVQSLGDLSDIDLTTPPTIGQVLKYDGTKWAPGTDITSGGAGTDADTLDGFDSSYFLNYNNFTNKPTIPTTVTVNGTALTLGSSGTITANTTNALTIGYGLTGTAGTFDGSEANTVELDTSSTAVTATSGGTLTLSAATMTRNYVVTGGATGGTYTIKLPDLTTLNVGQQVTFYTTASLIAWQLSTGTSIITNANSGSVARATTFTVISNAANTTANLAFTALPYTGSTVGIGTALVTNNSPFITAVGTDSVNNSNSTLSVGTTSTVTQIGTSGSTFSHTVNISSGATAGGYVKNINIGTNLNGGTGTINIATGVTSGTSTLNIGSSTTTTTMNGAVTITSLTATNSIVGSITGNAATATKLGTARAINGTNFDGSAAITITAANPNALTIGSGLSGTSYDGSTAVTIAVDNTVALRADTHYIGTTSIALNRTSASQTLTGVSIDGNAETVTNGVYTTGTYADPAWITSLAYSKLTGTPTIFSGSYNDLTDKPTIPTNVSELTNDSGYITAAAIPAAFTFNVAADDSSLKTISSEETVKFIGSTGIDTTSDAEGTITIAIDSTVVTLSGSQTLLSKNINGSNNTITNIANSSLTNSSITVGTTAISLGSSSTTLGGMAWITFAGSTSGTTQLRPSAIAGSTTVTMPATTGTLITTGDTGTVTNAMLAGSIANNKLANSSVTVNGTSISLGSSGTITAAADTLTGSTLASGVTASSLTSVGTLNGLTVNSSSAGTALTITATTAAPYGGSATWKFIGNGNIGGVPAWIEFPNGSVQTTAWTGNADTVTNGVYTTDTGTVTNTMLAGSIANAKLANSSVTVNGTSISLGASATVTAAAGTLTGTTLNSTVISSSLTSVGTLTSLTSSGTVTINNAGVLAYGSGQLYINGATYSRIDFGEVYADPVVNGRSTGSRLIFNPGTGLGRMDSGVGMSTTTLWNSIQDPTFNFGWYAGDGTGGGTPINLMALTGSGNLTVKGDLLTSSTSASIFNTTATTLNIGGAATSLNMGASSGTTTINNNLSLASGKTIGTTGSITANASTAFIAGDNAISNVALQMPSESALRNLTNGATNMYFDVSIGGSTQGQFQFRSSSSYTNILTMSSTGVSFNTDATFTSRTPSLARTAFNSAIDTEITVDNMRFRISNQGGIFPQVIGNGSSRNLAWTGVGAISGSAVAQAGSTGTIVASNAWTTLYNLHGMDNAGDTVTVTLQDKAAGRIYRITFMRSDNGSTTGYNIIGERLL